LSNAHRFLLVTAGQGDATDATHTGRLKPTGQAAPRRCLIGACCLEANVDSTAMDRLALSAARSSAIVDPCLIVQQCDASALMDFASPAAVETARGACLRRTLGTWSASVPEERKV
jgi:hypothetical protein